MISDPANRARPSGIVRRDRGRQKRCQQRVCRKEHLQFLAVQGEIEGVDVRCQCLVRERQPVSQFDAANEVLQVVWLIVLRIKEMEEIAFSYTSIKDYVTP